MSAVAQEQTPEAAPRGEPIIEFKGVWKRYSGREVLAGLNLDIRRGEVLCVLGPSGTGKSVMLRHINGLTRPDEGEVIVFGQSMGVLEEEEMAPIRRRTAMLFQGGALFDSMNVGENIAFPIREHFPEKPGNEVDALVAEKLRHVGLPGVQLKMPSELSGGMRKRVALARSIALEPEVILYDEPTTGLDPVSAEKISELIVDINVRLQTTSVVVTHDVVVARTVADRLVFLHQGKVQFIGDFASASRSEHPLLQEYFRALGFPCGTGAMPAQKTEA
jgi:phospholipid/cholesterol/gamma-HCH transport system ATP-binding protein